MDDLGEITLSASISPDHEDSISTYSTRAEVKRGFPGGSVVNNSTANARDDRDFSSIPGSGRSDGGGHDKPIFLPGESHGQKNRVGYSPWCWKELDMTEQLSTLTHTKLKRELPGGSVVKNSPASVGDAGSIPGWGRSHKPQSN